MDVLGVGVLLLGKSGIGKSEAALDLIMRGHRLVADDLVEVRRTSGSILVGWASELIKHHMEVRGLGIINIKDMFGVAAVRDEKRIELVLELIRWDQTDAHDRLGLDEMVYPILEVPGAAAAHPGQPGPQRQLADRGRGAQPAAPGPRAPLGARISGAPGPGAGRRARAPLAGRRRVRLVVVTGVSGAGKSTALRALEDLGFYAVDNLPLPLVPQLIDLLASRPDIDRTALGIDARSGNFLADMASIFADLRARGHSVEVLFLEASDEILIRRFSETRRRHPLSDTDIRAGISAERQTLAALRQAASALVDTGALNVHVLRGLIQERYGRGEGELAVTLLSFGFKHGIPAEADIVLDVRFLPNPFFVPDLSALSGEDEAVARFVLDDPETQGVPRRRRAAGPAVGAGVPARGEVLRDRRHRLHGRPSSFGRDRQGAGAAARRGVLDFDPSPRHRDLNARFSCPDGAGCGERYPPSTTVVHYGASMATGQMGEAQVGLVIVTHGGCGECLLGAAAGIVGPVPAATAVSVLQSEPFDDIVRRVGRACDEVDSGAGHPDPRGRARIVAVSRLPGDGRRDAPGRDRRGREPADAHQAGDLSIAAVSAPSRWPS